MNNEQNIIIKDSLGITQMRKLIEITNIMAKAINKEEFKEIMNVYGKATNRILKEQDLRV